MLYPFRVESLVTRRAGATGATVLMRITSVKTASVYCSLQNVIHSLQSIYKEYRG
jgi:3,4-dihydroxy-2-butanone 4-phosphate synthase